MKKRIIAVVVSLCILSTCFIALQYTASAATTEKHEAGTLVNGITNSNDNATILQCWNWSYTNLKNKIPKIAEQGFSVVQISPPNEIKEGTVGHKVTGEKTNGWWMFYQPAGFQINQSTDNALGTKDQLIEMVEEAHKYGVRVIADSVINHMGTANDEETDDSKKNSQDPMVHLTPKAAEFEEVIVKNKLFHSPWFNMTYQYEWNGPEDTCTRDLTRGCTSRLPDLKTEDQRVQDAIYDYLKELVDAGIDGFRFDAAKHIETPQDLQAYRSDFWTDTVTKVKNYAKNTYNKNILSYGEILNTCGYNRKYTSYFPFMKVTDSTIYRQVQKAVIQNNPSQAVPQSMSIDQNNKSNVVLWNESHDTYMDGESKNFGKAQRNKTWAAIAARDSITSMYLARPASLTQNLGVASETDWTAKEVAMVNKFNNIFDGQGEYLGNSNGVAVVGRGSSTTKGGGAVLINCAGSTSNKSAANIPVATMSNGTYKDQISGTNFVVSGGKITSGTIGNTGIAVLYPESMEPTQPATEPPTTIPVTTAPPTVPPTTVPPTTVAPTTISQFEKGDVNRDKLVNIKDVTLIQKDLVNLIAFDTEQKWLADFDADGRESIKDATKIQYKLAGIS